MLQSRSGRFWGTGNTLLLPGLESRTVQTVAELNRLHSLGSPEITLLAFEIIFGSLGLERCFYEGRTESYEQLFFFACEPGTADEGECGGRWNQLLCYP